MQAARDYDDKNLDGEFEGRSSLRGLAQMKFDMKRLFVDPIPGQLADLSQIVGARPFDVLLHDVGFLGMHVLAKRAGLPHATFGISALPFPSRDTAPFGLALRPSASALGRWRNRLLQVLVDRVVFGAINRHYVELLSRELERSPTGSFLADTLDADAYLQASVPGFEYARSDLPAHVHFIGPFLPEAEPFVAPPWWSDLDDSRPVVPVTQGTAATRSEQLIVPTLNALANEDVWVVATTGKPLDQLAIHDLPANARVASFLPYAQLMPRVDVMVTNGGYGGVQIALAHGVPLLAAGNSEDKPEIARRIDWSGVGIDLRSGTPSVRSIRAAVRLLLEEPRYRDNARRLQTEIARYHAPTHAVQVVEQLMQRRGRKSAQARAAE